MAIAAAITPHSGLLGQAVPGPQDRPGYDPPAAHGLRGSHAGAFEVAHQLRDGTFWTNAGQPESAMSGALGVQLGGGNYYGGEFITAERIGGEFSASQPRDARRAIRIASTVALLGLGAGVLLNAVLRSKRRG